MPRSGLNAVGKLLTTQLLLQSCRDFLLQEYSANSRLERNYLLCCYDGRLDICIIYYAQVIRGYLEIFSCLVYKSDLHGILIRDSDRPHVLLNVGNI